ncbi:FliO/MopB family protein [Pyxidicoccus sp. MSG2]|uniref:FliO/MopB family protein n=1 Tax=Pyxidicoccus sp. MSG2 TaxID=2996790 RepID=UPI00226E0660|nr:flagellar biosynthetic protein FliO [Pyxidicoccus sp. MSG2]MCY1015447.1 flagellar biosynthetic protein FliO [Pyxidicoccus sp. MSG2]
MAVLRPPLMRLLLGAALVLTAPTVLAQAPSAPVPPGGNAPVAESAKAPPPATAPSAQPASAPAPAAKPVPAAAAPTEPAKAAPAAVTDGATPEAKAAPAPADAWEDPTVDPSIDATMGAAEEPESLGWTLVRTLLVLGAVVASIYLTLNVGLRRLMGLQAMAAGRQPLVSVVERLPLDQRRSLFVVKAADEYLLVGGGEAGLQLLSKLDSEAVERIRAQRPQTNVVPLSPFLQKLLSRRSGGSPSQPPGA